MDFKKELVINFIEYNKATFKPESSVGYLAMLMNWFCGILCGLLGAYPIFTSISSFVIKYFQYASIQ